MDALSRRAGSKAKRAVMYTTEQDHSTYRVSYRSYLLSSLMLVIPPALVYEYGAALLAGNLAAGELVGLALGVSMPLLGAWYLIEFACFSFSLDDGLLRWQWRNIWRRKVGEVALERIVRVGREGMESSDVPGLSYTYRLIVELDDGSVIPLTRGFSGLYARQLDDIVARIREHIGQVATLR